MAGFPTLKDLDVTLTLDWVTLHTVMHHLSTYTYTPNFIEIEETCGQTNARTVRRYAQMDGWAFETGFIRSPLSKS